MCSNENKLRAEFTAYLELVIRHAKIDYLRVLLRRRSREELYDVLPVELQKEGYDIAADQAGGFQNPLLDRAFDTLSETRQKVLTCFFVHRMTAKEIAKLYGYSEKYVYLLKHRSLQALKKYIKSHSKGGEDHED